MPARLHPDSAAAAADSEEARKQDALRALSRSPHPYHHLSDDLPHLGDRFELRNGTANIVRKDDAAGPVKDSPEETDVSFSKESTPASESGTEADDEHFLKGLPAPRTRLHKGLRGRDEPLSGSVTPLPSPSILEQEDSIAKQQPSQEPRERHQLIDHLRKRKNWVRRATETGLVTTLGCLVASNSRVAPLAANWSADLKSAGLLYAGLLALYPARVIVWQSRKHNSPRLAHLRVPTNFDPAPLLYPQAITTCVAFLVGADTPAVILPNIIISLSTIPQQLVPTLDQYSPYESIHWFITCLPLTWGAGNAQDFQSMATLTPETLALLYPLHRTLCAVLRYLTTTSLLESELQLLSVALMNVLLLAISPQMQILKSLLWVGGLALLVLCGSVIRSGITLARVPKWRFRPSPVPSKPPFWKSLYWAIVWRKLKFELQGGPIADEAYDTGYSSDGEPGSSLSPLRKTLSRVRTLGAGQEPAADADDPTTSPEVAKGSGVIRRHTLPHPDGAPTKRSTHTPSGRRKRGTSVSVRPFLKLTYGQSILRKWMYAIYVYLCMAGVIAAGIRLYIQDYALGGQEPIGWGLGYAFGELSSFRFQVVNANLERWIRLPPRLDEDDGRQCGLGAVQSIRHNDIGEANTRLVITAYWFMIFVVGLLVVFRLKDIYEVDTRRKVFHFMMVGMLLPATFVDPTYAALVLSLVLAVFLMLDLLRASQLPPLSKPIATFLAPYVDGRDFRGPVVISHIFLLIGCAIPLWLALATLPRIATGHLAGWEVPTRDVSMVAGVVCVGLGDAAASLIGRRYGHRKWLWGGGKSIEGSVAFAAAVFLGLATAGFWLRVGGWPKSGDALGPLTYARNTAFCASMASVTEAVLTGGNDNVIVPVMLWTCVKSLDV